MSLNNNHKWALMWKLSLLPIVLSQCSEAEDKNPWKGRHSIEKCANFNTAGFPGNKTD